VLPPPAAAADCVFEWRPTGSHTECWDNISGTEYAMSPEAIASSVGNYGSDFMARMFADDFPCTSRSISDDATFGVCIATVRTVTWNAGEETMSPTVGTPKFAIFAALEGPAVTGTSDVGATSSMPPPLPLYKVSLSATDRRGSSLADKWVAGFNTATALSNREPSYDIATRVVLQPLGADPKGNERFRLVTLCMKLAAQPYSAVPHQLNNPKTAPYFLKACAASASPSQPNPAAAVLLQQQQQPPPLLQRKSPTGNGNDSSDEQQLPDLDATGDRSNGGGVGGGVQGEHEAAPSPFVSSGIEGQADIFDSRDLVHAADGGGWSVAERE